MLKSPATPIDPQTVAAFRYGLTLLEDHPDRDRDIADRLHLSRRSLVQYASEVRPLTRRSPVLGKMASALCDVAVALPDGPKRTEMLTTARAVAFSATSFQSALDGAEYRAEKPATTTPTCKPKHSRGVFQKGDRFYAINGDGDLIADIMLGTGRISPRVAINTLHDLLEKWEGPTVTNVDDEDDEGEQWKQGAKP